jgi:hypothetical protein
MTVVGRGTKLAVFLTVSKLSFQVRLTETRVLMMQCLLQVRGQPVCWPSVCRPKKPLSARVHREKEMSHTL